MRVADYVKIWFQNRRTKWKKIDNISNVEAAEHKNNNKTTEEGRARLKGHSQSSNSSIESDTKSSSVTSTTDILPTKTFKDILQTHQSYIPLAVSPTTTQLDTNNDVLLNLSFDGDIKDKV
nr:unnamed protein product [Callosobruchus chinensis]